MKQSILTKPPVRALLALVSCALWGSAFSSVKEGYAMLGIGSEDWASQLLFAGIRFVLAGIMALAAGSLRAGHRLRLVHAVDLPVERQPVCDSRYLHRRYDA